MQILQKMKLTKLYCKVVFGLSIFHLITSQQESIISVDHHCGVIFITELIRPSGNFSFSWIAVTQNGSDITLARVALGNNLRIVVTKYNNSLAHVDHYSLLNNKTILDSNKEPFESMLILNLIFLNELSLGTYSQRGKVLANVSAFVCRPNSDKYTTFSPAQVSCASSFNITCVDERVIMVQCPADVDTYQDGSCIPVHFTLWMLLIITGSGLSAIGLLLLIIGFLKSVLCLIYVSLVGSLLGLASIAVAFFVGFIGLDSVLFFVLGIVFIVVAFLVTLIDILIACKKISIKKPKDVVLLTQESVNVFLND